MASRVKLDDPLDREIEHIINSWKNYGMKNIKKPDVIRMMLRKYKEDLAATPKRLPKSKKWQI